ncbi:MAG: hypothetical protein PHE55_07530 [Methylococcaceae bacterium]|nr:hypothetical protein [Methylococcaceae bacterium]
MMQERYDNSQPFVDLTRRDRMLGQPLSAGRSLARARFLGWVLMAFMLVLSVYLFFDTHRFFDRFQARYDQVEDDDTVKIRQYNRQLEALQDKMTVFVADSVENKLKSLEKNVTSGTVGAQELRTLEELKSEVKLLETYAAGKSGKLTDLSHLDHARFKITPGTRNTHDDLFQDLLELKQLLYFGIASCGFVGLMIGGYWWRINTRRLAVVPSRLLIGRPADQ